MSDGLGAGFAALTLLALLAGTAFLGTASTLVTWLRRRRTGRSSTVPRLFLVPVCLASVAVAGFGVLALYDESGRAAALFASLVLLPVAVTVVAAVRMRRLARVDALVATTAAWSLLFLPALAAVLGVVEGVRVTFDLTTGEAQAMGVYWLATAFGGLTMTLGTWLASERLFGWLGDPSAASGQSA